jgi:lipoprotein-releasing system permease protein
LNLEFLIAKRVGASTKKSFSKSILRLAVISIALSMMVMIVATAIVAGFKNSISQKIFGFWGHIHITSNYAPSSYAFETSPMNQNQDFYPAIDTIDNVHYQVQESDWIASALANFHNPNLYIALFLLFIGLVLLFAPKILKESVSLLYRGVLAFCLTVGAIVLLSIQEYQVVLKDARYQTEGGIRHIQLYILKEGIIKTKDQIEGIVLRGVGADYDWEFLQQYVKQGKTLNTTSDKVEKGILISETTASRLKLKLDDKFLIYFVQDGVSLGRKFNVRGIYKTGLEEYDRRFALVDVRTLQELNNWRPFHNYGGNIELDDEQLTLRGLTTTTAKDDGGWNYVKENLEKGQLLNFEDTASILAIIPHQLAHTRQARIGDTLDFRYTDDGGDVHIFDYTVGGIYRAPEDIHIKQTMFVNWWFIDNFNRKLPPQVSGFEIFVDNLNDLDAFGNYTNYNVLMGKKQYANTIKELEPNIFDWLSLTDMNERIILLLMILVSIINMTTSLMILILERTNMIGILKALGAQTWSIRKIFLYNATYIISYGLLWGNLIGIGLCLLQMQFGIITLPEDLYYVPVAPVELNFMTIFLLNLGTMALTLLVLIIPSWLVAKIDPVKAIRFS